MTKGYIAGIPGAGGEKQHFGAATVAPIPVGADPNAPTHLAGVSLFPSSSKGFTLLDASGLIRNDTGRILNMQGTVTYQLDNGTGGTAQLNLWSERSDNDGTTFTENANSLRSSEASNTSNTSQTKSSAVENWHPGESIRWVIYNSAGGTPTLDSPSVVVNGGNTVDGFSFYWQLNEV